VSAPSLSGRVVLVIEDHDDTRATLVQLLASLGAQVHEAPDGLAGLTELARWRPDVVFCDLAMPIMDGLEFARRMRENSRYHRVLLIAVTGKDRQPWHDPGDLAGGVRRTSREARDRGGVGLDRPAPRRGSDLLSTA
jgi:CheY-like chemotaxis protein